MRVLFFLVLFIVSCLGRFNHPADDRLVHIDDKPVYWTSDDFTLDVLVDNRMENKYKKKTYLASIYWNRKVDRDLFQARSYDFSTPAPGTCGWVSVESRPVLGVDPPPPAPGRYAYAQVSLRDNSSRICSAQVVLDNMLPNQIMDVVILHELGHALGLSHDSENLDSLMHRSVGINVSKRYITDKDIRVLRHMYDREQ